MAATISKMKIHGGGGVGERGGVWGRGECREWPYGDYKNSWSEGVEGRECDVWGRGECREQ
jgi:hypothetical protein